MGNGEQYIWKPPEDDEMLVHQNKALAPLGAHTVDSIQPSAAVVSDQTPVPSLTARAFGSLFRNIPRLNPPIDSRKSGASGWRRLSGSLRWPRNPPEPQS